MWQDVISNDYHLKPSIDANPNKEETRDPLRYASSTSSVLSELDWGWQLRVVAESNFTQMAWNKRRHWGGFVRKLGEKAEWLCTKQPIWHSPKVVIKCRLAEKMEAHVGPRAIQCVWDLEFQYIHTSGTEVALWERNGPTNCTNFGVPATKWDAMQTELDSISQDGAGWLLLLKGVSTLAWKRSPSQFATVSFRKEIFNG